MRSEQEWFGGEPVPDEAKSAFLARLRQEVGGWAVDGLSPGDTHALDIGGPLFASAEVPGMAGLGRPLQVGSWTEGPWAGRSGGFVLQGVWGDEYALDAYSGNDPECLTVCGIDAEPEQHAAWAAQWLLRQLRRPVAREEWLRDGRVVATTWRLPDTGTVLEMHGVSPRRLLRRAPDRVTAVR